MKLLAVFIALSLSSSIASGQSSQDNVLKSNWILFKRTHNKIYASDDEEIAR